MIAPAPPSEKADLRVLAADVLDALLVTRAVPELPPETPGWSRAFLDAFRDFRRNQRGREAQQAAERLGRSAAADPFRFFWELWQNADDAGATEVRFEVRSDALIISNNGRPLTTREVYSLLTVGGTTKAGDERTIGQWGVGSLALMRYSDRPVYRSGPWAFALEHSYTFPAEVPAPEPEVVAGLRIVAPLRLDQNAEVLAASLVERLNDEALLYMRHLRRVVVSTPSGHEHVVEIQVDGTGKAARIELGEDVWLRYQEELVPPVDLVRDDGTSPPEAIRIALARRARAASAPSKIYVFFPTQVHHQYPWRFSAPLDVTTGREGILSSGYNRWLLQSVGRAMVRAAAHPVTGNRSAPWNLIPAGPEGDQLLNEIWTGALDEMATAAWLPAGKRRVRAAEAAFAVSDTVRALLRPADLVSLTDGRRVWVTGTPNLQAQPALIAAGAMRVGPAELARILGRASRTRGSKWFLRAAAAAVGEPVLDEVRESLLSGACFLNSRGYPFSLRASGAHGNVVCNTRSEVLSGELGQTFTKNLVVLLHKEYRLSDRKRDNELDSLRRRIDTWLHEQSGEGSFTYESRFDASAFIKLFVVERSSASVGGEVADRLLSFTRDHLEAYVSDQGKRNRERAYRELGEALRVKAFSWDASGRRVYEDRPITEVHLPSGFVARSNWPIAASGVPGIWWCHSRYRSLLVRSEDPMSGNDFLKALGAADGPRVLNAPKTGSHNVHRFVSVTHNDSSRWPHFPHGQVRFGTYSQYGFPQDWESPDLGRVMAHIRALPKPERSDRGQALLRVFEEQWADRFSGVASATAAGYYSNGIYPIGGTVPARWLWDVMHNDWVYNEGGGFGPPADSYARTASVTSVVNPTIDDVCAWESRAPAVARALGFKTQVAADVIVRNLRAAKERGSLHEATARAYYSHLAHLGDAAKSAVLVIAQEQLIFSARSRFRWRAPGECLRTDQHATFGEFAGYVDAYAEAEGLWDALGIKRDSDLDYFVALSHGLAESVEATDAGLRRQLPGVYAATEPLVPHGTDARSVPVVGRSSWVESSRAFVTRSADLAAQLEDRGLSPWDNPSFEMHPRLCRALGVLDADRDREVTVLPGERIAAADVERRIHQGVLSFAEDLRTARPDIWRQLERRLREVIEGRVERVRSLRLRVDLRHPQLAETTFDVSTDAYYESGALYLSELSRPSDEAVAASLLAGLPLPGEDRWALANGLRLHLTQDLGSGLPVEWSELGEGSDFESDDAFGPGFPEGRQEGQAEGKRRSVQSQSSHDPGPPPPPVDGYAVQSDEGGDTDQDDDATEFAGGLIPRGEAVLKKPSRGSHGQGGSHSGPNRHSQNATEQRGVELLRMYVLGPAGIEVTDQRIRAGVGADLVGADGIYRELKTFSAAAPQSVPLTEHEYRRAGAKGSAYHLIVMEHVWGETIITIVENPLRRLRYQPTGGVLVHGWREAHSKRRVIMLASAQAVAEQLASMPS